jgi:hypothetical protein
MALFYCGIKEIEGLPLIYRKNKIVVGDELFQEILEWYHVNLHDPFQDRNYCTVSSEFISHKMEPHDRQYVNKCQIS